MIHLLILLASFGALAAPSELELIPLKGSLAKIKVPYTMGTHKLSTEAMSGKVRLNPVKRQVLSGRLVVAVDSITGEKAELLCHLRETLTLDYERSAFPDKHVCEDDQLPTIGPDSPIYPEITAEINEPFAFDSKEIPVLWTLHGKTQTLPLKLSSIWSETEQRLVLEGNAILKRRDFDLTVKKFLFIAVDEEISVNIRVILGAQP